jgi:hypothetical protein
VDDALDVGVYVEGSSDPNDYHALLFADFSVSVWFYAVDLTYNTSVFGKWAADASERLNLKFAA